ncbi:adenylate/guanylate cyclase domain-containing protein [Mycolicibacterium vinylchloridicum]|uniref:adenylate/guanylate cyclase domain-containing protein n=1 Tax=Mycolicibacterium vinylchloridicum TaxID=2736928 RepID=UPI0015CBFAC0|nr:adenylate/guanylate cyclase domain-containing protein [Mycolicibacterium vinylchloridicum]
MTLIVVCLTCGTELLESARFCHSCGSPVGDAGARPEYKQVTVVFADVVRSMDIAAAVGAERLREIMAELADRCAGVVRRFGGTVGSFTGDGIMAVFGAPVAFEDHAVRACLAALAIQEAARPLAIDVRRQDGIDLKLRIGLNSGEVIAGEMGSGSFGYTAVGEQVGLAQRMESIAPPGGVMLSESTASLVQHNFVLGTKEFVRVKGFVDPVPVYQLLSASAERRVGRRHSRLVGRGTETARISAILDKALDGSGSVVTVSGPPGIGKTRLVRESVAAATGRGFEIFSTYCESHTREISFQVVSRLLRAMFGIGSLPTGAARMRVRAAAPRADAEDLLLLDELLGIRDTEMALPDIGPDAWRRRLIELINTVSLARSNPAVYVIEDAHWIDSVSESILADFAAAFPRMRATMLITYRSEYQGALTDLAGTEAIVLAPLSDSYIGELLDELLGVDSSVGRLSTVVASRVAGIPFCAEEIVRDLAERGEIEGEPGAYKCLGQVDDVHVPPTLQAAIGDRIDRLTPSAKRTLNAAAVIGARFRAGLLERLLERPDLTPLIEAELVDQLTYGADAEYAFHHPLTQKVAYESQLKAARSDLHRRVAAMMQQTSAAATSEGAAMIATQLESAGELSDAYEWFMRAATGYGQRDIRAARASWKQAVRVADQIPGDDAKCLAMRISPRALLCGSAFRVGGVPETTGFEELRDITAAAGDKKSLAVGMAGHLNTLTFNSRHREAVQTASEFAALVESIGEPEMSVGLLYGAAQAHFEAGEVIESLRLTQRIIDLADGDPVRGNFVIGSPLAWAITLGGASAMCLGRPGWRADIGRGIAMARSYDAPTRVLAQIYKFAGATPNRAIVPDAEDISATSESLEIAQQSGDNTAVAFAYLIKAMALLHSPDANRAAGVDALTAAREMIVGEKLTLTLQRLTDIEFARAKLGSGELDGAIALARQVVDDEFRTGEMLYRGPATEVLGEALLCRGTPSDVDEAQKAVRALAAVPTDPGFVLHELPLLRLRALLARNAGDELGYRQFSNRFREKALRADFEGYLAQADAMG